jgi:hypothetical protein
VNKNTMKNNSNGQDMYEGSRQHEALNWNPKEGRKTHLGHRQEQKNLQVKESIGNE